MKPKLLITITDGVITDVTSTTDIEVTIIDFDAESDSEEGMTYLNGSYAKVEEYGDVDICTEKEIKEYINQ